MKQTVQVEVDTTKVEQEAYKKGLDDAWEMARKIVAFPNDGGLRTDDLVKIFGLGTFREVIRKRTASEALAKLREYEARQKAEAEAVKVGDEVTDGKFVGVVTRIESTALYVVMSDGSSSAWEFDDGWRKTGRHFPEIAVVLEQMKGE